MNCRLCSGQTTPVFTLKVLDKYDAGYFECLDCGSLMTEEPYWLDEAYAAKGVGYDTGAAQRELTNVLMMHAFFELLGIPKSAMCVDIGAGTGMFSRMMRDRGYDFTAQDAYTLPHYMDQFPMLSLSPVNVITAFEVLEHLCNPILTLSAMLQSKIHYIFFTTELWDRQGEKWGYLNPKQGQHVFFYSWRSLYNFAAANKCRLIKLADGLMCITRGDGRIPSPPGNDFAQFMLNLFIKHMQNPWQYAAADNAMLLGKK